MKQYILASILFLAFLAVMPSLSSANDAYQATFNALYPAAASLSCSVCHTNAPSLNPYGSAFKAANGTTSTPKQAMILCEPLDSDKDGYTNLTELQGKTYPGSATSKPAKFLFCDNFKNVRAAAVPNWATVSGSVTGNGSGMTCSPATLNLVTANPPIAAAKAVTAGTMTAKFNLMAGTQRNAYMVFGQTGPTGYRYVGIMPNKIFIGQTVGGVSTVKKNAARMLGMTAHTYKVVMAATGLVSVYVDNGATPAVSFKFPAAARGKVGLMTNQSNARFTSFTIARP